MPNIANWLAPTWHHLPEICTRKYYCSTYIYIYIYERFDLYICLYIFWCLGCCCCLNQWREVTSNKGHKAKSIEVTDLWLCKNEKCQNFLTDTLRGKEEKKKKIQNQKIFFVILSHVQTQTLQPATYSQSPTFT